MVTRRQRVGAVLTAVALLLVAGAQWSAANQLRAHPDRRLTPLLETLAGPAWELAGQAEVTGMVDGQSLSWAGPLSLVWAAPNRLRLVVGEGLEQRALCSDGKALTIVLGQGERTWRMPAPPDLTRVLGDPAVRRQVRRQGYWRLVEYFQSSPERPLVADWVDGPDPASAWVRELPPVRGSRAVTMALSRNLRLTCWASRDRLRRVAFEAPPATMQAIGSFLLDLPRPPVPDLLPGQVAPALPRLDLRAQWVLSTCAPTSDLTGRFEAPTRDGPAPTEVASLAHWLAAHLRLPLQPRLGSASLVGQRLPAFTARTLAGRAVSSRSLLGRPAVLEFGATWCPPSQDSIERLAMLQAAWSRQGVRFVAVFTNATTRPVQAFLQNSGVTLESWHLDWRTAEAKRVERVYRMVGIPRTLYVDRRGMVVDDSIGLQPTAVIEEYLSDLVTPAAAAAALAMPAGAAAASPPPAPAAAAPSGPR
ncbi:MAG: TlpA family protein disulfide reductase [Fimbriimonadaceae bacterium]|nr:TlpA family protein disulfide reductase [Fimbriimonadaceae bacterium]